PVSKGKSDAGLILCDIDAWCIPHPGGCKAGNFTSGEKAHQVDIVARLTNDTPSPYNWILRPVVSRYFPGVHRHYKAFRLFTYRQERFHLLYQWGKPTIKADHEMLSAARL